MPLEADIVTYLDAQLPLAAGTDLFEGPMPENTADPCVSVVHYSSDPSDDFAMAASLTAPESELESFRVMSRATTKAAAKTQADAIHAVLDNLQSATISGRIYHHVTSDGPPFFAKQDGNLRWYYWASYRARKDRG